MRPAGCSEKGWVTISLKNERIIRAWNAAEPDAAADGRMRSAILGYDRRRERGGTGSGRYMRVLIPVAACLTLLIAAAAVLTGGFGMRRYTAALENGGRLSFARAASASSRSLDIGYDFAVTDRELDAEELKKLSPRLTSGFATFRADTGELIRFEGRAGETKVVMAARGFPTTDTVVDEYPSENEIEGVKVLCGYAVANNAGRPVALFSGEFSLGETAIYVERASSLRDAGEACEELGGTIVAFITDGEPDFSAVTG